MIKNIVHYFDKLEDRIRGRLSRYPIIYTLIGGVGIVLFWRGVWLTTDDIAMLLPDKYVWVDGPLSVIVSCLMLLLTGLFVSFFITDKIILSGLKQEKKLVEKTEAEIKGELGTLTALNRKIDDLEKLVRDIRQHIQK
jgi:hypothetical protein